MMHYCYKIKLSHKTSITCSLNIYNTVYSEQQWASILTHWKYIISLCAYKNTDYRLTRHKLCEALKPAFNIFRVTDALEEYLQNEHYYFYYFRIRKNPSTKFENWQFFKGVLANHFAKFHPSDCSLFLFDFSSLSSSEKSSSWVCVTDWGVAGLTCGTALWVRSKPWKNTSNKIENITKDDVSKKNYIIPSFLSHWQFHLWIHFEVLCWNVAHGLPSIHAAIT